VNTLLSFAFGLFLTDQLVKELVERCLAKDHRHIRLWVVGFKRVANAKCGFFPLPHILLTILWLLSGTTVFVLRNRLGTVSATVLSGVGLVLGGAAGNLADKWFRGAIIDFIRVRPWRAFNVADAGMFVGSILAAWGVLQS
jgi:signal peptidase II